MPLPSHSPSQAHTWKATLTGRAPPPGSAPSHTCPARQATRARPRGPVARHITCRHCSPPSAPAVCPQPLSWARLDWGRGAESSRRGGGLAFLEGDSLRYF